MEETLFIEEEVKIDEFQRPSEDDYFKEFIKNNWLSVLRASKETPIQYVITTPDVSIMNWTIQNKLPEYFNDNLNTLKEIFYREYEKIHQKLTLSKEIVFNKFENISKYIAQLEFSHGTVELTSSHKIKFTLLFTDNKVLMVTKYLNPEDFDLSEEDIVFSLFDNKNLIASDVSEISYFISGFKKYLAM